MIIVMALMLAGVITALYLVITSYTHNANRDMEITSLSQKISTDVVAARASYTAEIDTLHQDKINRLTSIGVIDSEKIYSNKLDTCAFIPTVSGWVATDWNESCEIEYNSLIPSSYTKSDIESRLSNKGSADQLLGVSSSSNTNTCGTLFTSDGYASISYFTLSSDAENSSKDCSLPKFDTEEKGSVISKDKYVKKIIDNFNPADIDTTKSYIGISTKKTYYTSPSLGCKNKKMFCEPPFNNPITGY